jgi:trans-aconitate 2-methyltransferase
MSRYTYGDTDLAGDRLELVARMFAGMSGAFLRAASPQRPGLALDLGSGPGATTALVRATTAAATTVGVDRSVAFARRARFSTGLGFVVADVVGADLPFANADLLYARLLVAHLDDPAAALERWGGVLALGGRLLVDDLESIDADGVFRTYLDEVALAVVRAQGGSLLVGPLLHAAADPPGLVRVHDAVAPIEPPVADTARVFEMNLRVLTERGEVAQQPALSAALAAIARGERAAAPVRWRFRQIGWQRSG